MATDILAATIDGKDARIDKIVANMSLLVGNDQVVELRALGVQQRAGRPVVMAGFFDGEHLREMAQAALNITQDAKGVYFTLNPLRPDMLARRCNRIDIAGDGELSKDKDVIKRQWLLVDADPIRDSYVSANEEEKRAAFETIRQVRTYLSSNGWPLPILSDSGNGFHLLYPVDLPPDDKGVIRDVLMSLAKRFDNDQVKIDTSVHNAARICKMPGTLARKGDHMEKRPHRLATILEVPST